ncbi:hypothetical protein [Paraburkholderia bannensis]|uniref:hypothetical protein n=1 Tax=Paraburkholderia bannensis TaxID=765414 RepID=UPI002AB76AB1|nr:hypothetical protein [Paraburkholderia bannensis]
MSTRGKRNQKKEKATLMSLEAAQLRMDLFVARTAGWGRNALRVHLAENVEATSVLAGPTRKKPHS